VINCQSASRPGCLGVRHLPRTRDQFFLTFFIYLSWGFVDVERPVWWEDGSVMRPRQSLTPRHFGWPSVVTEFEFGCYCAWACIVEGCRIALVELTSASRSIFLIPLQNTYNLHWRCDLLGFRASLHGMKGAQLSAADEDRTTDTQTAYKHFHSYLCLVIRWEWGNEGDACHLYGA
jgi:hypothetical protein